MDKFKAGDVMKLGNIFSLLSKGSENKPAVSGGTERLLVVADTGTDNPARGDDQAVYGIAEGVAQKLDADLLVIDRGAIEKTGRQNLAAAYKDLLRGRRPAIVVSPVNDAKKSDDAALLEALAAGPAGRTLHYQGNPPRLARHFYEKSLGLQRADELLPHRLTPDIIAQAGAEFDRHYPPENFKGKLVALLMVYEETQNHVKKMADMIAKEGDCTVFISGSPRTQPHDITRMKESLQRELAALGAKDRVHFELYDMKQGGYNPYCGLIARAGHIIVSGYSISMVCEPLTIGKTVHITRDAHETDNGKAFPGLRKKGYVRYIGDYDRLGQADNQQPLNITPLIAQSIVADYKDMCDGKNPDPRGAPHDRLSWGNFKTVNIR